MAMRDRVFADLERVKARIDQLQSRKGREQAALDETNAQLAALRTERDEMRAWLDRQP